MDINIKNAKVNCLIQRLRELTGQGPTEIVKAALEHEYREQRRLRRQTRLAKHLATLQSTAKCKANDFGPGSLYNKDGFSI
ncbi:type II toxin-antitoxin system VapB family antitoxin [Acaryochloris thomasi]|uniref:type II toxin-antitoxin system VapB family antitoxin n=1 Tax=Acaryochloris thomasi TaxID=2929456 RepID=UPI000DA65AC1|nr:type II toxin-antitoxin system VapB family antitoxin [Acaryochloris thomasi]